MIQIKIHIESRDVYKYICPKSLYATRLKNINECKEIQVTKRLLFVVKSQVFVFHFAFFAQFFHIRVTWLVNKLSESLIRKTL